MFLVAALAGYLTSKFIPGTEGVVLGVLVGIAVVIDISPRFPLPELKDKLTK